MRPEDVSGLKVKPQSSGAVSILKAKQRGTRRKVTITYGKVANLAVREVRRWAQRDLALLSQEINPNTHKKAMAEKSGGGTRRVSDISIN